MLVSCGDIDSSSESDDTSSGTTPTTPNILVPDLTRANSYDDSWESAWIANVKNVLTTAVPGITKTEGKVLQVGDSMTFSFAYGLWARTSVGATTTDLETIKWMFGDVSNQNNGWDLSSGGVTAQNNMGWSNPKIDQIFIDPLLNDARFAILMMNLPANDPTDLTQIQQRVSEFIAVGIVPVLSTIPPRTDPAFETNLAEPYNMAIRALAEQLSLPWIDFSTEILLRRPNGIWENTLISSDGVHPSGSTNGFTPESDPYTPSGDPVTHTTGDATLNSGYLLRTWLCVQKIKEIKAKAID